MSTASRRARRDRGRKQRLGVVLLLVAGAGLGAIFGLKLYLQAQRTPIDPETLCPLAGGNAQVAILFDKTEPYNRIQQRFLTRFFRELEAELPVGARVSLFVVDADSPDRLGPVLSICNPGDGRDANALYENPARLQRRWRERFQAPLAAAIKDFMQPARSDRSPIMEMLQVIALTAFPAGTDAVPKRLIVVSDMLQHTPEWSHYRGQLDFRALQRSPYYQRVRTDLRGAEAQILYLRRDGAEAIQTKRHAYFWADYIESIRGRTTLIERIDG